MSDRVLIEGLAIDTIIGVYEWEQSIKQRLVIDLELAWDNAPAGASDALVDALDYAEVCAAVTDLVQGQARQLIERVAEEVAEVIIRQFDVAQVCVKVAKPGAVPSAKCVAVMIERRREEL